MLQIVMVSLEDLVSPNHQYRKFASIFDFDLVSPALRSAEKDGAYKGYGVIRIFLNVSFCSLWKIY